MLIMPNCKETSRLVSHSMDRQLPLFKRMLVWMHLRMCKHCKRFEQQLLKMREISRHINHHFETFDTAMSLSAEARERIRKTLRAHSRGSH